MGNISKEDLKKQIIFLICFPFVPAFLFYKHSDIISAMAVLALFWSMAMISIVDKSKAAFLNSFAKKIIKFTADKLAVFVLTVVYFLAVLPTGLLMKLVKRDRLKLAKKDVETYWEEIPEESKNYEFQF